MEYIGQVMGGMFRNMSDGEILDIANQLRFGSYNALADLCIEELQVRAGRLSA